ncbi:hypothetical protein ACFQL7_01760 [Halocatena marina]|uniref:Uncharacterized protein n=1 Tax=Halocatena marina TaxID=2934937 RepID=A0ABD5YNE8_9EURY
MLFEVGIGEQLLELIRVPAVDAADLVLRLDDTVVFPDRRLGDVECIRNLAVRPLLDEQSPERLGSERNVCFTLADEMKIMTGQNDPF